MKNNNGLIITIIAAITLLSAVVISTNMYKNKYTSNQTINVTGNASTDFESDLVKWRATFSRNNFDLKTASNDLKIDQEIIKKFLIVKGIDPNEIIFDAVNISKDIHYGTDQNGNSITQFNGYILSQDVTIESKDLDKIDKASREISNLISDGIELNSSNPNYYYSKLEDLKLELIAQASENARARAENIAIKSKAKLGQLNNSSLGVFQITSKNDNEEYSYGGVFNTSARKKTANITVKASYLIK